jgi:CRP/FNR family cyclic AMP-dependent transcriptional regulator
MEDGKLGKIYRDGEAIIRQGEMGDRMYIIQDGRVRVTRMIGNEDIQLAELKEGDFFGEMAIIDREVRSATVFAVGEVRLLSIDKNNFLRRIHEDPSLAYRVLQRMSHTIRELNTELSQLKLRCGENL